MTLTGARHGDLIPVLVHAADGPVLVWHTPDEYALLRGPEPELGILLAGAPWEYDCECETMCECEESDA